MAFKTPPDRDPAKFALLPMRERAVLWSLYLAERTEEKEVPKSSGFLANRLHGICGLVAGYAWCAAKTTWILRASGFTGFKSSSVVAWRNWAEMSGRVRAVPQRGMLAYWANSDGMGHMGLVVEVLAAVDGEDMGAQVVTVEANTPGCRVATQGVQIGVHRHVRQLSEWDAFIEWW